MPGTGFWFFVLIIAINVVVGIVRKVAERRAAREAALKASAGQGVAPPRGAAKAERTLQGGAGVYEVILERSGERQMDVLRVLRHGLGMDPASAMIAIGSAPTAIAVGLSRSDAGLLRNRLEEAGASVAIRRTNAQASVAGPSAESFGAAIERFGRQLERSMQPEEQAAAARAERARSAERAAGSRRATGKKAAAPKSAASKAAGPKAAVPTAAPARTSATPALPPRPELPAAREAAPSPWRSPQAPAGGERTAAEGRAELDAGSIRAAVGDSRSLQRAFILAELLQPPLSMRPHGSGGR